MAGDFSSSASEPSSVIFHGAGASHVHGFFRTAERARERDFSGMRSEPGSLIFQKAGASHQSGFFINVERRFFCRLF